MKKTLIGSIILSCACMLSQAQTPEQLAVYNAAVKSQESFNKIQREAGMPEMVIPTFGEWLKAEDDKTTASILTSSKILKQSAPVRKITPHKEITLNNSPLTWNQFLNAEKPKLSLYAGSLKLKSQYERQLADQAVANGFIERISIDKNGARAELVGIRDGQACYYTTHNSGAADTMGTDELWPSGASFLDLTGTNTFMGMWDANELRSAHVEFNGRALQMDDADPYTNDPHPTQVAGTMMAQGVNASAKGMAFEAFLDAYDWNDDHSEMADAASTNDLQISNHSYARATGWNIVSFDGGQTYYRIWYGDISVDTYEDYKFGFYSPTEAREIDAVVYQAKTYLPIWSAGNEYGGYNSGPPSQPAWHYVPVGKYLVPTNLVHEADGGAASFDLIPPQGVAKNILTVGAIEKIVGGYQDPSDVVLASFSSVGPTDDGRIKPDVVAPGVNVFTSHYLADNSYETVSGTSFSSPAVAGSLNLVSQLYTQLNGTNRTLMASTLKAIAIHTADEAGTTGPDYSYGWGVFNTLQASILVTNDYLSATHQHIKEFYIPDQDYVEFSISATNTTPLKITTCWTDPEGPILTLSTDPTNSVLINDLDLRLVSPSGVTNYPWVLNPQSPASAATTGDNSRDNVEQVYIQTPENGDYTISLTHKGSLSNGWQTASMLLSGNIPESRTPLKIEEFRVDSGTNTLEWTAVPGAFYQVLARTNLIAGAWEEVTGEINALRPDLAVTVTTNEQSKTQFFKLQEQN